MIRAALLALAYVGIVAALLVSASIHHRLTLELVGLVLGMASIVGFVIFIDETMQRRRKWRDRSDRRHPIIKDWK